MFRHVVMFRFNDDVGDGHAAAVAEGFDALPSLIPEIRGFRHGPDAGISEGNHDYVLVADFDSAEDYVTYRDHPAHQEFVQRLIAGRISTRAAVQHEL